MAERKVTISTSAPTSPNTGDGWIHPITRVEKRWDGSSWIVVIGEWTAGKLLKGAGDGANPIEIDVPSGDGGDAVAAVEAAGLALASGKNIKVTSVLTVNDAWSGLSAVLTAGEIEALGEAVYLKQADSEVYKALATGTATMPGIALATCATTDGSPFEFLLLGFMRHDAWDWTPGGLLYIDRTTAGALTQTAPATTGDQVQVVGIAITADIILFNPGYELVEIS